MLRSLGPALLALVALPATASAAEVTISCAPSCSVAAGTEVTFTAAASGAVRDLAWDLDEDGAYGAADGEPEGPRATQARRAFAGAGRFVVAVRARDPRGAASFARQLVTVADVAPPAPPSTPPTAPAVPLAPPVAGPATPRPPALHADDDGDRVLGARDVCPDSPAGRRPQVAGCSVLDALVAPRAVLGLLGGPDTKGLGGPDTAQSLRLGRLAGAKAPLRRLGRGLAGLRTATLALPGAPCEASSDAGAALRAAKGGLGGVDGALSRRTRALGRAWGKRVGGGDAGEGDGRLAGLLVKRERAHALLERATRLRKLLGAACAADDGKTRVRGRVASITGAVATLAGGRRIAFGAAGDVKGLAPGVVVQAQGQAAGGGVLAATQLAAAGAKLKPLPDPCRFTLHVAPVQDFGVGPGAIVFDDARAFRWGGFYRLEHGMRIGAARVGCAAKDDYSLQVWMTWGSKAHPHSRTLGVLRGTLAFEAPLWVPDDVPAGVTLHTKLFGHDCETPKDITVCDGGQVIDQSATPASVHTDGFWARAVYNRTQFSVEDGSSTLFDVGSLKGLDAPQLAGAKVFGVGYAVTGGLSEYPQRSFILQGQDFAVYDDIPTQAEPHGLFMAYANGFHDGFAFHYVATLPDLVTDGIEGCDPYRLPWRVGTFQKTVQGNNSEPTHSGGQKYAFDFKMPKYTPGRATRGGLVTLVVKNRTKTSNPKNVKAGLEPWLPGNLLLIRHQDGTTSFYTHMVKNGVIVEEGDYVERGDPIIVTGKTGNASGPHLHYHVTSTGGTEDDSYGGSVPIRFEGAGPRCTVPKKGSFYLSTNS